MNKISQEILYLANLLQVPAPDRFSQDWEYELNIDSTRVNTFLDVYEMSNLSDYQKELLLKIIIEMINDSMENGNYEIELSLIFQKVKKILEKDFIIHKETIYRYANLDYDLSDSLLIAPFFRKFLKYQSKKTQSHT